MSEEVVLDPRRDAAQHVLDRKASWFSSMQTKRKTWARLDKRYYNYRDDFTAGEGNAANEPRANIGVPLAAETVDTAVARAYELVQQGELGDSLYLIARGVVRVSREEQGELRDLGTLIAGDFFGEMALMHHESRNASVRTITPCQLYELRQRELEEVMQECPELRQRLAQVDAKRQQELQSPA